LDEEGEGSSPVTEIVHAGGEFSIDGCRSGLV
jgi:hypothetical protein